MICRHCREAITLADCDERVESCLPACLGQFAGREGYVYYCPHCGGHVTTEPVKASGRNRTRDLPDYSSRALSH